MKASKFSDAQKAFILKQGADGMPVAEVCRKAGISHPSITLSSICRPLDGGSGMMLQHSGRVPLHEFDR